MDNHNETEWVWRDGYGWVQRPTEPPEPAEQQPARAA